VQNLKAVNILLRISIASVFLYAAIAATLQPQNWLYFIPQFAKDLLPEDLLLHGFSLFQLILSLWILSGKYTFYAASLACLTFLAIIAANFNSLDILFRDFAIFFSSLALAVGSYKKVK
jgi:uncharacterized membrane protein YphA (DoxX/SURF4 family)